MSKKPSREQLQKKKQEERRKAEAKASQELWRLPWHGAWITEDDEGWRDLTVARQTPTGLLVAIFLIDFNCRGIVNATLRHDCTEAQLQDLKNFEEIEFFPCDEASAGAAIATAHRYARRFGIDPHREFRRVVKILGPNTLELPDDPQFVCGFEGVPVWSCTEMNPQMPNPLQQGMIEKAGGYIDPVEAEVNEEGDYGIRFEEEGDDDLYFDRELAGGTSCDSKDPQFQQRCLTHAAWICEQFLKRSAPEDFAKFTEKEDPDVSARIQILAMYLSGMMMTRNATPGVMLDRLEALANLAIIARACKQMPAWEGRSLQEAFDILKDFWEKAPQAFAGMDPEAAKPHLEWLDQDDLEKVIANIEALTEERLKSLK